MGRTELVIVFSIALFSAFLLGWVCCVVLRHFTTNRLDEMAAFRELGATLRGAQASYRKAVAARKPDGGNLEKRLRQKGSELRAAKAGLDSLARHHKKLAAQTEQERKRG